MKFKRKIPLPIEAMQFLTKSDIKPILLLQSTAMNSDIIKRVWDSLYHGGKRMQSGDWIVKEGDYISVYTSDKFEILFKREQPNFAIPTLADIA